MKQQSCQVFDRIDDVVDTIVSEVGNRIILGIPLGIGKPNPLVNALYQRVLANPALHLTIITALSLQKPHGSSELEKRFIDPFVERVFGDYPDLDYVLARRGEGLPPNVRVIEFFVKTGDYLNNDAAQQDFLYSNYTNAARDMFAQGVNVLAQAVAVDGERLSLSGNPDVTLDLFDLLQTHPDRQILKIACHNLELPFMENQAVVSRDLFDIVLTDQQCTHQIFAPPNMKVSLQDCAIAIYASTLVKDGGTLQIGIGSLGDAIAKALVVRDQDNANYQALIADLFQDGIPKLVESDPFSEGLYGCSEMFVNGFMQLIKAGLIRREVFDHLGLQTLLDQKKIGTEVNLAMLGALLQADLIKPLLRIEDVNFLKHFGIFKPQVKWISGRLQVGDTALLANVVEPISLAAIGEHCLGTRLTRGILLHGGFYLGPRDFYQALRDLTPELRQKIGMSRISFINSLGDDARLSKLQRRHARFINTTMVVSLLGAASSDSLDSGRVVSGVGGQFNFVSMADAISDARSILMLRSTHASRSKVWSNIVWSYAQTTIPRHLRDIVITEYGIADLRGQIDSECVKRMLAIADSRFQNELLQQAKQNGKIEADYQIPESQRHNSPAVIETRLRSWREKGILPDFPFGTDFTDDEVVIVRALRKLKSSVGHPLELMRVMFNSFMDEQEVPARYLERMHLDDDEMESMKIRLMRRLFIGNFG